MSRAMISELISFNDSHKSNKMFQILNKNILKVNLVIKKFGNDQLDVFESYWLSQLVKILYPFIRDVCLPLTYNSLIT